MVLLTVFNTGDDDDERDCVVEVLDNSYQVVVDNR